MSNHIITLSGGMCAGKSTLARVYADRYPYIPASVAFKLKLDLMGFVKADLLDPANKVWARPLMQAYGNAMCHLHGDGYWAAPFCCPLDSNLIVDDVRRVGEIEALREYHGEDLTTVYIDVPFHIRQAYHFRKYGRYIMDSEDEDISERALRGRLDLFDIVFSGDNTIAKMVKEIRSY